MIGPEPDSIPSEAILLEWRRWVETQRISPYVAQDLNVIRDHVFGVLQVRLTRSVLTQKLVEDDHMVTLEVPASWWDHWKLKHGLVWLGPIWMRRWPARMVTRRGTVHVEHVLTFPEAEVYPDQVGRPIRVDVSGPVRWEP